MKRKLFKDLSKRKRRSLVISLKNNIRKEKSEYGGKFLSDVYFNTIDNHEDNKTSRHWIDIYFLSKKDPSILWNATVITCIQELEDKAETYAFQKADEKLDKKEKEDILRMDFEDVLGKDGKTIACKVISKEPEPKEQFEGRTYYQEIDHQQEEFIKNNLFDDIYERYEVYKDYSYGIGVTLVVNEKTLNQEAIERAIENFYLRGEREWVGEVAIDRESLMDDYEVFKASNMSSAPIKIE